MASSSMRVRHLKVRITHEKLSGLQGHTVVIDGTNKLLFRWVKEEPYLTTGRRYGRIDPKWKVASGTYLGEPPPTPSVNNLLTTRLDPTSARTYSGRH